MNGLFHPYFVNYGRDKIYFFWRLYKEGLLRLWQWAVGAKFYILPQSFGVDLPHLITSAQKEFVKQARSENKMFQLYYCLVNMDYECLFNKAINCCKPLYLRVKNTL